MLNNRLLHFKKKEDFLKEYNAGNIREDSIVLIKDTREIWSHNAGYQTIPEGGEINQILGMTEEGPQWINRWKTLEKGNTIVNGYEFVDMGLSVDWATCNIGATKPEESGWYFMWGDTTPYNSDRTQVGGGNAISFDWGKYKYCNGSENTMTKYCTSSSYGTVDNKTIVEPEDDAAVAHIGGNCRIPNEDEYNELLNVCDTNFVENYNGTGVNGMLFTLKSDTTKTLFFPANGNLVRNDCENFGEDCYYWCNSIYSSSSYRGVETYSYSNSFKIGTTNRCYGQSVRAVKPKS